jgi:hypothetical protein
LQPAKSGVLEIRRSSNQIGKAGEFLVVNSGKPRQSSRELGSSLGRGSSLRAKMTIAAS